MGAVPALEGKARGLTRLLTVLIALAVLLPGCKEDGPWPPKLGQRYPDLQVIDHHGNKRRLSDFAGKVLLVEPVGMNCPACNAYAGAQFNGGFNGLTPQEGLASIEQYLPDYGGGVTLGQGDLVLIHLVLYDFFMEAPDVEDARMWAEHFGLDQRSNVHVVIGARDMRGRASFDMVPGFHLVDRQFVLRKDSTGHRPRHNLYSELLPEIPALLAN